MKPGMISLKTELDKGSTLVKGNRTIRNSTISQFCGSSAFKEVLNPAAHMEMMLVSLPIWLMEKA